MRLKKSFNISALPKLRKTGLKIKWQKLISYPSNNTDCPRKLTNYSILSNL